MNFPILTARINADSLVNLRDRTRQVGETFGLEKLQNTRFITAVSEIARNVVQFAGQGTLTFHLIDEEKSLAPQQVTAVISDNGPGIADIEAALQGRTSRRGKAPVGIVGTKRLVDNMRIECPAEGGTRVTLGMSLPRLVAKLTAADFQERMEVMARLRSKSPLEELENQNREMLDTLEQLRFRQQELENADLRKNQFLGTLAHELRNPLGTLEMILEILRRTPEISAKELGERREAMARQTKQLTMLIEDLMDVSRVSQGKVDLKLGPVELNELVAQAMEMTSAATSSKSHVTTLLPHDGQLWVDGDHTRLKQAFGNLIQNAARYTPSGGTIDIRIDRKDNLASVSIRDNGQGIHAEELPFIFELFMQGRNGNELGGGGLGVGLTLVKKLVEGHRGVITATSEGEGKGSCFTVVLPLKVA